MKLRCRKVVEDEEFKPLKHYLLAWIAFLSWVTVLGFLRALMWVLAIRSSGKAPILVDINDRPLRKTPSQWGIWSIKMPIMEFLERSSIFSGFFVCVVRAGTWCPRLNLWGLWFIYTGECRASFTFIQAIHFQGLVTYNGPYMAGTRVSMSPSPPSDESKALIHLLYWGLWMLEPGTAYLIHFIDSILVMGDLGGWVPHPLVSFTSYSQWSAPYILDHSLLQQFNQHTSHPEHFARSQPLLEIPLEPILSLRHTGLALITALTTLVSLCIHCWAILSWQRSTVLVASGDISSTNCAICPSNHSLVAHHAAHDRIQLLCLPCFTNPSLFQSCGPSFW